MLCTLFDIGSMLGQHHSGGAASRRPSLSRYGHTVTTATIATSTNDSGNASTETDKLLDQHQMNVQVDQPLAVSSVWNIQRQTMTLIFDEQFIRKVRHINQQHRITKSYKTYRSNFLDYIFHLQLENFIRLI